MVSRCSFELMNCNIGFGIDWVVCEPQAPRKRNLHNRQPIVYSGAIPFIMWSTSKSFDCDGDSRWNGIAHLCNHHQRANTNVNNKHMSIIYMSARQQRPLFSMPKYNGIQLIRTKTTRMSVRICLENSLLVNISTRCTTSCIPCCLWDGLSSDLSQLEYQCAKPPLQNHSRRSSIHFNRTLCCFTICIWFCWEARTEEFPRLNGCFLALGEAVRAHKVSPAYFA